MKLQFEAPFFGVALTAAPK